MTFAMYCRRGHAMRLHSMKIISSQSVDRRPKTNGSPLKSDAAWTIRNQILFNCLAVSIIITTFCEEEKEIKKSQSVLVHREMIPNPYFSPALKFLCFE